MRRSRGLYWGVKLDVHGKSKNLYAGKKVIILGLAKSGVAIAKVMKSSGAQVTVNDRKPEEECQGVTELRALGIRVICGEHPSDLVDSSVYLVIKNPGIPYGIDPIQKALELGIPVVTEVEVAYEISDAPYYWYYRVQWEDHDNDVSWSYYGRRKPVTYCCREYWDGIK